MAIYNKNDEKLEAICKKLNAVKLEEWHNEEQQFYTQQEGLKFCLSGYYDEENGASEVSLHILDAETEKVIKEYDDVSKMYKKFEGLVKRDMKQKIAKTKKRAKKLLDDFVYS